MARQLNPVGDACSIGPCRAAAIRRANHGHGIEGDLLLVLQLRAVQVMPPAAQPQSQQNRSSCRRIETAACQVENQIGFARGQVFRRQCSARFFKIDRAVIRPGFTGAADGNAHGRAAAFNETFEKLAGIALEARGLRAFAQCLFQSAWQLALVGNMRDQPRA